MPRKGETVGASWQLVFGAALHWASMLYQGVEFAPSALSLVEASRAITPLAACAAVALALFSRFLERRRVRLWIAGACVVAGIACLALTRFVPDPASPARDAYLAVLHALDAVNIAIPITLWGYAFASLDKRTAGHNVVYTALVSFVLAMALSLVSLHWGAAALQLNILARCVSGIVLMRGGIYFSEDGRPPVRRADAARTARFYGGRLLMGAAIGTLFATVDGALASPVLMVAEMALCLVFLCVLNTRKRDRICEVVPVAPVALTVLLWFPFAGAAGTAFGPMSFSAVWLAWLFVSSFQLSGLKESLGMSAAFLSVSEKAALLAGWSVGLYAGQALVGPETAGMLSFAAVSAALIWATASSVRTVYSRQEDDFADRVQCERADREARVLAELRDRFDLTAREAEIALLLAHGHSRPGICSQLGISDGTVRAHSSHIYAKLDVHRRDELILAIQAVEGDLL